MRAIIALFLIVLLGIVTAMPVGAAQKLSILLIDGQNNHDWKATTPVIKANLLKSGRFTVEVLTSPAPGSPQEAWGKFRPDFKKYDAIFVNYNSGEQWPAETQKVLEAYMAHGGGLVIYHAANNAFPQWVEWNKMIGLNWQLPTFGDRITIGEKGEVIRTPKGVGPGAGHGPPHPYEVIMRDTQHPITKSMPAKWIHVSDELYHGQRGPAVNMHILASAWSDPKLKGTGANEPMIYTVRYGKGRVFVNLMGHAAEQVNAPDMVALLARGSEWAATGRVTIPLAKEFKATKPVVK